MKRMSILGVSCLLFLSLACEKGEVEEATDQGKEAARSENNETMEKLAPAPGGSFCACTGYQVIDGGGDHDPSDYYCDGSGGNCTIFQPCPCPSKSGTETKKITKADIEALDRAIENDKLPSFFNGDLWSKLFPDLKDDQETLTDLRNGDVTLTAQEAGVDDRLSYLAVPDEMSDDQTIHISDIRFCMTRPIGEE